jgi:hypothetical protein
MILDVRFKTSKLNTSTGSVQDSLTGFILSRQGEIVLDKNSSKKIKNSCPPSLLNGLNEDDEPYLELGRSF